MTRILFHILSFILFDFSVAYSQLQINNTLFFEEDKIIVMDLTTDLKSLVTQKKDSYYQPAVAVCRFPDSSVINEQIQLSARGNFRRENCYIPSIKLDFSNPTSPQLASLRKLKLVCGCDTRANGERLLLKEFLIYKIYNIITDMSFRVRMLRINYNDSRKNVKSFTQYGFLIEDVDEMAKRNKCFEVEGRRFNSEWTDRQQMTLVAVFQYMIGNTDWSVPNYHNIKLMGPVSDSVAFPFTVPYDFDFSGLVNADYAAPPEELPISSVKERLYRGFARSIEEVQATLDLFRKKRTAINTLVLNFEPLGPRYRKEMISYLDEFYTIIENNSQVKKIFIDNARKN